jgi:hypothetical protein
MGFLTAGMATSMRDTSGDGRKKLMYPPPWLIGLAWLVGVPLAIGGSGLTGSLVARAGYRTSKPVELRPISASCRQRTPQMVSLSGPRDRDSRCRA